jgi:tRNA U34 5-carboxymethylaminomethyl modifying GTPase MnmE/TrmE
LILRVSESQKILLRKGSSLTNKNLKDSDLKLFIFRSYKKIDKKILKLYDEKSILVLNKIDIKKPNNFSENKIYKPVRISVKKRYRHLYSC